MNQQDKLREIRFYVTLGLGYGLMLLGCLLPPVGVISNSVIMASGIILALSAMVMGIDLTKVIRELRQLNREFQEGTAKSTDKYNKEEKESESDA